MTAATRAGVTQIARTGYSFLDIPAEPDLDRMRGEVGARLQAAMAEQGPVGYEDTPQLPNSTWGGRGPEKVFSVDRRRSF